MTHLEMSLAFVLFCKKYDGYNVEDIPNIRHLCIVEHINLEKVFIVGDSFGIDILHGNQYNRSLFYMCQDGSVKLNRSGKEDHTKKHLNIYYTFKDFTNDFNLSIEDIV